MTRPPSFPFDLIGLNLLVLLSYEIFPRASRYLRLISGIGIFFFIERAVIAKGCDEVLFDSETPGSLFFRYFVEDKCR